MPAPPDTRSVIPLRNQKPHRTRKHTKPGGLVIVVLAVALVASALGVLALGSVDVSIGEAAAVIARRMRLVPGEDVTVLQDQIVWQLRLPRVIGAIAVGMLLAMSGAILQTLTGNELADPYLLGISSGASVGAVAIIVFNTTWMALLGGIMPQSMLLTIAAFVGALGALVAVLALATGRSGQLPAGRTILAGVAIAQLCGATVSLMIMGFGDSNAARTALAWTLGSFAGMRWHSALIVGIAGIIALLLVRLSARTLDGFAFGDLTAQSLGIPVTLVRWILLVTTALLTAISVAFVGPIGFIGLTVPHIMRLFVGPGHKTLLPAAALAGGLLALWSDTLARSLIPGQEIPVGVITAVVGTPVLIILLRRQAARS